MCEVIIKREKLKLLLQDAFVRGYEHSCLFPQVDYAKDAWDVAEVITVNFEEDKLKSKKTRGEDGKIY